MSVNAMLLLLLSVAGAEATLNYHRMLYTDLDLTPWPRPISVQNGTGTLLIQGGVSITANVSSGVVDRALGRYTGLVEKASARSPSPLPRRTSATATATVAKATLAVNVGSADETLGQDTDESYVLTVDVHGAGVVTAASVFGALHGLESWSQLIEAAGPPPPDGSGLSTLQMRGLPWSITDAPRFAHRGVLLDTSRHFLPISTLEQHIDTMGFNKLNLLHLHLVDAVSFPFASAAAPALVRGAYSLEETYTPAQLQGLVSYAKDRGVRVMVEVDTPGHSASWGVGYPDVTAACPIAASNGGFNNVALDPSHNHTFEVLEQLLGELGAIFTDTTFHLGGDEVRFECWNESASVKQFMVAQGYGTDFSQLEAYYEGRLLDIAAKVLPGRTLMVYQEVFDNNITLPDKIVFGVWKARPDEPKGSGNLDIPHEITKIVKAGHQVVLANGNNGEWYLNDGFGNGPTVAGWADVYELDPTNGTDHLLTPQEQKLVIGGEVSLWGEEINHVNLASKAWPRASAFAERMWTPKSLTNVVDAGGRLVRMYCKMEARGCGASPISPGSCYQTV